MPHTMDAPAGATPALPESAARPAAEDASEEPRKASPARAAPRPATSTEIQTQEPPLPPRFEDLRPLRAEDRAVFAQAIARLREPISDYSFACAFMWAATMETRWGVLAGHLCVFADSGADCSMLWPPLSLDPASDARLDEAAELCFALMDDRNARTGGGANASRIEYVSDEILERFRALPAGSFAGALPASPMWGDYVYDTARMIDLAGGALKSKRGARSRFMRAHPEHRLAALTPELVPECVSLLARWREHGHRTHEGEVNDVCAGTDTLREKDEAATRRALEHAGELGLTGAVLLVAVGGTERVVGFTLGEELGERQATILIEKTDPEFEGAAQTIFSAFCERCWAHRPEINASDDWGIPSLRFTKQSYRPIRMLQKSELRRAVTPLEIGRLPGENATPAHALGRASWRSEEPERGGEAAPPAATEASVPAASPTQVVIREASPRDAEAVSAVERASFQNAGELFSIQQIRRLIRNPRAPVLVAESEGRIVGWAVGLIRQHRGRGEAGAVSGRLYGIAVDPSARGLKVGRRLAEAILGALEARGAQRIYLEVREDNAPAIGLYESLGFRALRRLESYYGPGIGGVRMRRP